ncbi:SDR family NAD(P)-dependent oxidoreductase [Nocardioides caldifontis]|uniref:SDR family NAD(P)-dependent oxidoreductase n=1 Tax=Nocardioides caldifontis TaxID=2588938 RepID=UPI0011DFADE3|nr:SDR family NAD(P)-dependent oxidoreductase [Nocardioides caldifontis]
MTTPTSDLTSDAAPLAVVTGGSSGIGLSLARGLLRRGHDVVVAAEDSELATATEELRAGAGDREVMAVPADLSMPEGVTALYDEVAHLGRPVDVLALNAGIGVGGRFWETSLEDDLRLVDLNVRSTVHLAKLVVRDMVARGSGRVLVTASIAAKAPGPYHATYAASKAFVHSFAEGIRHELSDTGVTVTSLMPGPTDTEFFERADMEDTKVGSGKKDDPDDVAEDGLDALFAGKDHVVAGSVKNKAMAAASSASPDRAAAATMGQMTKPGSGS